MLGGDSRYTSAVRATWVNETPTAGTAASNPSFGFERIPVHTLMIETFLSRNLLEDVAVDVVGLLTRQFAEAAAIEEDECFLVGNGVGKPQGVLPGGANSLSLAEVVTGSAAAITADGLRSLKRAIARQYRDPAVFVMESGTAEDIELLKDGEGRYFFDLDNDQLLRKPLLEDEAMPSVGANTYPIIYGDLGGYFIADRVGMTVERYLDSATARINQVVFVMRRRLGGQCVEPWRLAVQKVAASSAHRRT